MTRRGTPHGPGQSAEPNHADVGANADHGSLKIVALCLETQDRRPPMGELEHFKASLLPEFSGKQEFNASSFDDCIGGLNSEILSGELNFRSSVSTDVQLIAQTFSLLKTCGCPSFCMCVCGRACVLIKCACACSPVGKRHSRSGKRQPMC